MFLYFNPIINGLIRRLGGANTMTRFKFEKRSRLFFEKSAVSAGVVWRSCHVEAGGQNSPLLTRFKVGKVLNFGF